ncbi:hypothetical protein NMS10_003511 [Vibrio cholerae]|nr:hypothetical protein [Vibrio cholerae]EGR0495416.1 hypothetical protein [Vibrio cholerae]EGR4210850.1 hypothetical protein [Vibrio cholerae]EGR4455686.1 hypothetical protein [Vibrio cholerae]EHS4950340.1 hypothetical protein [Vibrio cholerae]EJL6416830.1 hypothetical protein [Vibrio cholerae]
MEEYFLYTSLVFLAWGFVTFICARYWIVDIKRPSRSKVACGLVICVLTALTATQMSFYKAKMQVELSQEQYKMMLLWLTDKPDNDEEKERNEYLMKVSELNYNQAQFEIDTYASSLTNVLINIVTILGSCIGGALLSLAVVERFDYRYVQLSKKDAYDKAFKRDSRS